MKKIFALALAAAMSLSLAACGGNNNTPAASSTPAAGGTHGTLPGTLRRPGGGASRAAQGAGSSGLYTTFRCFTPRRPSSRRITRARGQP